MAACNIGYIDGNSIFLPAAGYYDGSSLNYDGGFGIYWSSTLYDKDCAYYLAFGSVAKHMYYGTRYYGFTVRPVTE